MNLDDLVVFAAVAEALGISAAAKRLHVPKSSVSRALVRLEKKMGIVLVQRSTRHVSLTSAGRALFERTQPLLQSLANSLAEVTSDHERPSGVLRVTTVIDFGVVMLADIITRFRLLHPAIRLDVHLSNQNVDLLEGAFDAALRMSPRGMKDSSLVAKKVAPLSMQLFASPHYLASRGAPRTPEELSQHDWVSYRGLGPLRLDGMGRSERISVRGQIKCDDMMFARAVVRAGGGLGVLPTFLAGPDAAQGELVRVLPRWDVPRGGIWLVYPRAVAHLPKFTAFRDFVTAALASSTLG